MELMEAPIRTLCITGVATSPSHTASSSSKMTYAEVVRLPVHATGQTKLKPRLILRAIIGIVIGVRFGVGVVIAIIVVYCRRGRSNSLQTQSGVVMMPPEQQGFNQTTYSQAAYPSTGYQQTGYSQAANPRTGYPMAAYPQTGYQKESLPLLKS